jgi:hypothetical protein
LINELHRNNKNYKKLPDRRGRSGIKDVNLATKAERGFFFLQWSKDGLPRGTGVSLWLKEASKNNCKLWAITMTITRQQLHTLRLLRKEPACRVYRTHRAEYYTWIHKAPMPLAHLMFGEVYAVNDNELRFPVSRAICPYHLSGRKADEALRPRRFETSRIMQRLPPPFAAAIVTAGGTPIAWESGPTSSIR